VVYDFLIIEICPISDRSSENGQNLRALAVVLRRRNTCVSGAKYFLIRPA
jgi:hypothetical protein